MQNERRSYRGFKLFEAEDEALFSAIARGEFNVTAMPNKRGADFYLTEVAVSCPDG